MKISELVAIKHSDLDLENKPPLIKIGRRTVTLTDKIFYILKDYVTVNKPKKIADYLFITRNNDPIHIRNMRTYISRVIRKAGVDKTINDLRNTFIVRQLDAGNSIEFVGNVAGHSSKQATERYLKLVKNYKDKGLNRIVEV
jgi:integrase